MIIRIGQHHLSFTSVDPTKADEPINYEPYVMKSGISVAANLREALRGAALGQMGIQRALAMVDVPILLIPVEFFDEEKMADMYTYVFPKREQEHVLFNVLPDLNSVAVFSMNKDLKLVLDDNFGDLKVTAAMTPVWRHLHKRSFSGARNKLYGYFHDQKLEIFSFQQNRIKFYNQFEPHRRGDALYFLLYVWKQLSMNAQHDELHLISEWMVEDQEWIQGELRKYLQKVYTINPQADFNRAPATKVKGMPFDLVTMLAKGR